MSRSLIVEKPGSWRIATTDLRDPGPGEVLVRVEAAGVCRADRDLFEGGDVDVMRARVDQLVRAGVTVVVLLALSDEGAPIANHNEAAVLAGLGAYVTACTPNEFPELLTSVLDGTAVSHTGAMMTR